MPQSLPGHDRVAKAKSAYPALPCLSLRNHKEGCCPHSPVAPFLPPDQPEFPCIALPGMACPLPLGTMSNKLSFQWPLCPDPLASPPACSQGHLGATALTNFCQNRCSRSCYSAAAKCLPAEREHSELGQLSPKPHRPTPWGPHKLPTAFGPPTQGWHLCECVCVPGRAGRGGGSCHPDAEPSILRHG